MQDETCPIETIDVKTRQRLFNYTLKIFKKLLLPWQLLVKKL